MSGAPDLSVNASTVGNRVRVRRYSDNSPKMVPTNVSRDVKLLDNNPPSVLKADDISEMRRIYGLSASVGLRLPLSSERAADARPDEVVVYELYFHAGMRNVIPSLVGKMAKHLAISPGQLFPSAFRWLIAIQAFGELESINLGVDEVLYAYYFTKYETDPGRYSLHTRNHPPLATDLDFRVKRKLEEGWRERYVFMRVGHDPGFPTSWFAADAKTKAPSIGRAGAVEVVKRQPSLRSVEFLTSKFALENSTIWGSSMSNIQQSSASEAFARFMKASGKLAEANPSVSLHILADSGDEVQCLEDVSSHKRKAQCDTATSSEVARQRIAHSDQTLLTTTPLNEFVAGATTTVEAKELKSKVLSHDFESLVTAGINSTADGVYFDLLKAMSAFHLVERKLSSEHQINEGLKRELDNEKSKTDFAHKTITSKDNDISRLEAIVRERDQTILDLRAYEVESVRNKDLLHQEIMVHKKRIESLKHELDFYLNGAAVIARWEAVRECLLEEHKKWNLPEVDMQYQTVKRSQAQFKGMPPPVFEESLVAIAARERVGSGYDTSELVAP